MWAIALKELRQLRRDRRTVAMLFLLPLLFLVVFGYAASFDVTDVPTVVVGNGAPLVAGMLPTQLHLVRVDPAGNESSARDVLRRGEAVVAVVTPSLQGSAPHVLVDGTEIFAAQAAQHGLAALQATASGSPLAGARVDVLFNPGLRTAVVMIPGLCGVILVFVGTIATASG